MRLALLPGGTINLDKGRVVTPGVDTGIRTATPVWSALIETDDGRYILMDTGMHPDHITDPDATYRSTPSEGRMLAEMTERDLLPNRLQSLGVAPDDIDTVLLTHLHWDHCGQTHLFERATVYVRRDCLEQWSAQVDPRVGARDFLSASASYAYLPDAENALFAPGVTVIHTPGHAVGHVSLLVELPETGPVLLPVDALPTAEHVTGISPGAGADMGAWAESRKRLLRIAGKTGARLFLSHDPAQWAKLRHAPHWYA